MKIMSIIGMLWPLPSTDINPNKHLYAFFGWKNSFRVLVRRLATQEVWLWLIISHPWMSLEKKVKNNVSPGHKRNVMDHIRVEKGFVVHHRCHIAVLWLCHITVPICLSPFIFRPKDSLTMTKGCQLGWISWHYTLVTEVVHFICIPTVYVLYMTQTS